MILKIQPFTEIENLPNQHMYQIDKYSSHEVLNLIKRFRIENIINYQLTNYQFNYEPLLPHAKI